MGHIFWKFSLKNEEAIYPSLETWVDKFSVYCGLKIVCETTINKYDMRTNKLYHTLLSEEIYFESINKEIRIERPDPFFAYLCYIILEVALQETIKLGDGWLNLPLFPKRPPLLINQKTSIEDIFEYLRLEKNDLAWAKYPYELAKNIAGFRA